MIITFYSFKGGVGRSMALANVANWLRLEGIRVALVDWDLEAPGLECFLLEDSARRAEVQAAPGLLDLLVSYKERYPRLPAEFFAEPSADGSGSTRRPDLSQRAALLGKVLPPLSSLMVRIAPENQGADPGRGPLSLLAPGVRDGERRYSYARDVQSFDWGELYSKYDGEVFFEWMRSELERDFDITLIDSRTGVTEVGGVCTREMADVVIAFCAANDQNLEGSAMIIRSLFREDLLKLRHGRRLRAGLVPARYDNGETDALLDFKQRFTTVSRELQSLDRNTSWRGLDPDVTWELRLPYTPKYAYRERLCVGASDANPDLLRQYQELSRFVAKTLFESSSPDKVAKLAAGSDVLRALSGEEAPAETLDSVLERAYAGLPATARDAGRVVLERFVGFSDPSDPSSATLQIRRATDFPERLRPLLGSFEQARLIEPATPHSEAPGAVDAYRVSYPNAVSQWARLRDWIAKDGEFLRFRNKLQGRVAEFEREHRSPAVLGASASLVRQFRDHEARHQELNERELEFVSLVQKANKPVAWRVWLAASLGVVILAALGMVLFARSNPRSVHPLPSGSSPSMPAAVPSAPMQTADDFVSQARSMENLGALESAKRAYSSAIERDSTSKDAYAGRGALLFKQGSFELAEHDLAKAAALGPKDAAVLLQLGKVRAQQGKFVDAIENFNRSIDVVKQSPDADPKSSAPIYYELAEALRATRKFSDAVTAYGEALRRGEDLWDARYGRAIAYLQLEKKNDARSDFQAVAAGSSDPSLRDSAVAQLKSLGVKPADIAPQVAPKAGVRVYVQNVSAADKPVVDRLVAALGGKLRTIVGVEHTRPVTKGDVRSFFPADRAAAARLKKDAEEQLSKLGYDIQLTELDLDAKAFPRATPGSIELWLPALDPYQKTKQSLPMQQQRQKPLE